MSINKTREQKIQDIINRVDLSTLSVKWWEKEMDKELHILLKEIDDGKEKNKKKGNRKKII